MAYIPQPIDTNPADLLAAQQAAAATAAQTAAFTAANPINSDPYFSSPEYAALTPDQQQAAIINYSTAQIGQNPTTTSVAGDTTNYNSTGESENDASNQNMNANLAIMGPMPAAAQGDETALNAWLMKNPSIAAQVNKGNGTAMQVAPALGIIPSGWKAGGNGLVNDHAKIGTGLEVAGLALMGAGAAPIAAGALGGGVAGAVGGGAATNAAMGAMEGKTPEEIALAAGEGVGGALGSQALGSALSGGDGLSPIEQAALNTGAKTVVGAGVNALLPSGTTSPTQQIGNTLANSSVNPATQIASPAGSPGSPAYDPTTGLAIPGATYNANGTIVDSTGTPMPAYSNYSGETTTMPGSGPTSLGTLGSIASQLAPVGSALSSAASAAGNTQRANIDTNSAAQTAYNNGLISRAQLEDTQRQNEAQDVARQSFLTNFTGGSNVTAGGQTGLTPMSPLEQQTLSNLANQGATALSSAPTYSAANMTPLTNYTGAANQTGTSPVGTALSTAGPLLNIGAQLAGLAGKVGGGGNSANAPGGSAGDNGAGGAGPVLDSNGNVIGNYNASGNFTAATIPDPGIDTSGIPTDLSGDF